jgi:hypothetical protein
MPAQEASSRQAKPAGNLFMGFPSRNENRGQSALSPDPAE